MPADFGFGGGHKDIKETNSSMKNLFGPEIQITTQDDDDDDLDLLGDDFDNLGADDMF